MHERTEREDLRRHVVVVNLVREQLVGTERFPFSSLDVNGTVGPTNPDILASGALEVDFPDESMSEDELTWQADHNSTLVSMQSTCRFISLISSFRFCLTLLAMVTSQMPKRLVLTIPL